MVTKHKILKLSYSNAGYGLMVLTMTDLLRFVRFLVKPINNSRSLAS